MPVQEITSFLAGILDELDEIDEELDKLRDKPIARRAAAGGDYIQRLQEMNKRLNQPTMVLDKERAQREHDLVMAQLIETRVHILTICLNVDEEQARKLAGHAVFRP